MVSTVQPFPDPTLSVFLMTAHQSSPKTSSARPLTGATACLILALLPSSCALSEKDGLVNVPVSEAMAAMQADRRNPEPTLLGIAAEAKRQNEAAPVARKVPRQQGVVFSPHTDPPRKVDVGAFKPGARIVCPYTSKLFRTAEETPRAVAATAPREEKPAPANPASGVAAAPSPDGSGSDAAGTPPETDGPTPFGTRVPGRAGFVYSPYGDKLQLVDVSGIAPGVRVECPYSKQEFRVPPEDQTETASAVPQTTDLPLSQESSVPAAPQP